MEKAFEKTHIAFKDMQYVYTLKIFFKDEFQSGQSAYLIPFSHILYIKRNVFQHIRDSCGYVCPYTKDCDGHQFLNYIQKLWDFLCWAVEEKKMFYKYFYFGNFRLTSNGKISGWDFKPVEAQDLSHLPYSRRMSYLN